MASEVSSGGKCTDLSVNFDQIGSLLRMSVLSELEAWTGYALRWNPWDTKYGVSGYQLRVSDCRTKDKESLLWATPRASDKENRTRKPTPSQIAGKRGLYLAVQVLFPTPTATNYGSNQGGAGGRKGPVRYSLHRLVQMKSNTTGKNRELLNPEWELQLMGFPGSWLSVPSAMRLCPPSRMSLVGQSNESNSTGNKESDGG